MTNSIATPALVLLIFTLLITAASRANNGLTLEVIALKHRPADSLVPLIRPLLPEGGSVNANGNQLIIHSNDKNLAQLNADRPVRHPAGAINC